MFYLIRHGEADYENNGKTIYKGIAINFAPLTANGIEQLKIAANDYRLKDANIILSSPYTRALQSAAILSKELQIDIIVEPNIYEWLEDINCKEISPKEGNSRIIEFNKRNGDYPKGDERLWEDNDSLKNRLFSTLKKYIKYKKVIVVCHGMLIHSVDENPWLENGEIFELDFKG